MFIFKSNNGVRMDESKDPDYESARLDYVGFVDPYALEGLLILKSDDGREFLMRAFSGEVAKNIKSFSDGGERESTIYAMFEDVCEQNGDVLVKVKIYESGEALRANLYLTGKKEYPPGIIGPFSLQSVITRDLEMVVYDVSLRVPGNPIVATTSPYTKYQYGKTFGIGRRIAMEIRRAINEGNLGKVTT